MSINLNFFTEVQSFISDHTTLCVLTLGLAIVGYSIGNLAGRAVVWFHECFGTAKKASDVAQKILNDDKLDEPQESPKETFLASSLELNRVEIPNLKIDKNFDHSLAEPSYKLMWYNKEDKDQLMKIIQSMRQEGHRINLFEKDDNIFLHHTKYEMNAWMQAFPQLNPYFRNKFSRSIFDGYLSSKGFSIEKLKAGNDLDFWEKQLASIKVEKAPHCHLPSFSSFKGSQNEIQTIFTSLLKDHKGIIIGERHSDEMPKQVLIDHMLDLYSQGVRTLFLEHCCFDTLQSELDDFYKNKAPSPFLKKFLLNGCGEWVGDENYFDLVNAAVQAGIRPVGLESSATQEIGFTTFGSDGASRRIAMNMCGKEIIEKEALEGKYIALVGSAHSSYSTGVPGLSEICQVPSMIIEDTKTGNAYFPNCINLNFDKKDVNKIFENLDGQEYFAHAYIKLNPEIK